MPMLWSKPLVPPVRSARVGRKREWQITVPKGVARIRFPFTRSMDTDLTAAARIADELGCAAIGIRYPRSSAV